MNLYQYTFTGDPQQLLAGWQRMVDQIGKDSLLMNVVTTTSTGITVLDVCPTEADFQGWINGDDWRAVKAELGGQVVVTPLGEIRSAVVRDGLLETVRPHAHAD